MQLRRDLENSGFDGVGRNEPGAFEKEVEYEDRRQRQGRNEPKKVPRGQAHGHGHDHYGLGEMVLPGVRLN